MLAALIATAMLLLAGCGSAHGSRSSDSGTSANVKVSGRCPAALAVGVPFELTMRVKNQRAPGNFPATFVTLTDGFDHFTIDSAYMGARNGTRVDTPGFVTYRFPGVQLDNAETVTFELVPKEAGNTDLKWGAWRGAPKATNVPDDLDIVGCKDVPINP